MAEYRYECTLCGAESTHYEGIGNAPDTITCYKCKSRMKRVITVPNVIIKNPDPHRKGRGQG